MQAWSTYQPENIFITIASAITPALISFDRFLLIKTCIICVSQAYILAGGWSPLVLMHPSNAESWENTDTCTLHELWKREKQHQNCGLQRQQTCVNGAITEVPNQESLEGSDNAHSHNS